MNIVLDFLAQAICGKVVVVSAKRVGHLHRKSIAEVWVRAQVQTQYSIRPLTHPCRIQTII